MKALVLTPGVKGFEAARLVSEFKGDIIYLTNPLYQSKFVEKTSPTKAISDDDLSTNNKEFTALTESSLSLAGGWFRRGEIHRSIEYRGISLGEMTSLPVAKYLISVLRSLYLYDRLFKMKKIDEVVFVEDESVWGRTLQFFASNQGIPCSPLKLQQTETAAKAAHGRAAKAANHIGKFLKFANSLSVAGLKKGGIVFSSAPWYSMPMLRQSRSNYYLRPVFSEKAFFLGKIHSFSHIIPDYFYPAHEAPGEAALPFEKIFQDLDLLFQSNATFNYQGANFWPVIRKLMQQTVCGEFKSIARSVDAFYGMMDRLKPRAVVVEEEVNVFNKTLVACANRVGIKTYCLIHAAPFMKSGNVPSGAQKILAWGPSTKARLVSWGIAGDRIAETGAPQFEHMKSVNITAARKKVRKTFSIPDSAYLVLLALSDVVTYESTNWKYPRMSLFQDVLERSLKISLGFVSRHDNVHLVIKLHPRYKHAWVIENILKECGDPVRQRTTVVKKYPSDKMIAASDLVLATGSTIYYEAALLGRPAMVYDYSDSRFCSFMTDEFLDLNDPESCWARLREVMQSDGGALQVNRAEELRRHFWNDGRDAVRKVLTEIEKETIK